MFTGKLYAARFLDDDTYMDIIEPNRGHKEITYNNMELCTTPSLTELKRTIEWLNYWHKRGGTPSLKMRNKIEVELLTLRIKVELE